MVDIAQDPSLDNDHDYDHGLQCGQESLRSKEAAFLRVAVPVPLADAFDYRWPGPGALPRPGCRVRVPFGRGHRIGLVMARSGTTAVPQDRIKCALEALDEEPLVGAELLDLLRRTADYYHHPIGEVASHALPGLLRKGRAAAEEREQWWRLTPAGAALPIESLAARAPRQAALLAELGRGGAAPASALRRAGIPAAAIANLAAKRWVEQADAILDRREATPSVNRGSRAEPSGRIKPRVAPPELTPDQGRVLAELEARPAGFVSYMLHGVTGSGKTEIFLRLIEQQLAGGRQTLLLVPEIGLTPQLVERLRGRVGEQLAVMHSGLTDSERLGAWRRARSGDAAVIVGTRSAVFCELRRPGLVIVDEEHDPSYKQQHGFRYSARDLAVLRASRLAIPVLLASATPSLETLWNASQGRYRRLELPRRIGAAGHPRIKLIDLNRHSSRRGLSQPLLEAIERHLGAGNQVLLFLNRRGFAPVLLCPGCGDVEQCPRCDARLTVHAAAGELRCHHCGGTAALRWACPHCGSERAAVGAGTQRVTEELRALYPEQVIGRLDRDSTSKKGALDAVLAGIKSGETRIVVGTQMLTKGHDFPRMTLVGVLNADQGLFGTELRSSERFAQTLIQVAGRAGRADSPGEVLIQTHFPRHPMLEHLLGEGYGAFATFALEERRRAGWPPYSHLALWRAEARERKPAFDFLERLRVAGTARGGAVELLGPAPDPMERKAARFRARLLLQCRTRHALHALIDELLSECRTWPESRRVRWSIDVDPLDV